LRARFAALEEVEPRQRDRDAARAAQEVSSGGL
jgi:hypothetical protein